MITEDLLEWFHEELLPAIVKSGRLAEGVESPEVVKCEFEGIESGVSSFASAPYFAKLILKTASGTVSRNILVKFQCQDPLFREKMLTVPMYNNEVTMYNKVLPAFVEFLKSCGRTPELVEKIAPKCYFASQGGGDEEKAIVILEDLREYGFRLSDSLLVMDLRHCLVSVERLAEFHAFSFALKHEGWGPFEALKRSFEEVSTANTPNVRDFCEVYLKMNALRGIDYLLSVKESEVPRQYLENLKRIIEPMFDLMISLKKPKEPFSVICHGDFNRNNILYRYTDGEVTDARLFDYQRWFYGSPSIDLSFFIYMNTTLEFREKYFDELLAFYYATLVRTTSGILGVPQMKIADWIPLQGLKEDFARVAIHGYIIIAFFLPHMMDSSDTDFENNMKTKSYGQMAEENITKGGEAASRRIADVLVDFYRRGFYK